jgi:peptidyl-dipeptidase A
VARSRGETPQDFIRRVETRLLALYEESNRADWVYSTYVNPDTEFLSGKAGARLIREVTDLARQARRFQRRQLPPSLRRRLELLRVALVLVGPSKEAETEELARLVPRMQSQYAQGRHTLAGTEEPLDLQGLSKVLEESRDPKRLQDAWEGWHRVGRSMRKDYTRYVQLANRGARELGFRDLGALWRSRYELSPDAFAQEVERLWKEVEPLYRLLHAYVRVRLREVYGPDLIAERGPLPAHLMGNMWAQSWMALYPLLSPPGEGPGYDLTRILVERKTTPQDMVRMGEGFFTSLGLPPLPKSFWERSLFTRPRDREVVCHASAWDLDGRDDLRLKMCIEVTEDDFGTIHHELGHNYYQRAYSRKSPLFRESAHDGFHEAVGDTIALSVTPDYLSKIGLLKEVPASNNMGWLLRQALEKVAFRPFGLLVDRWRWEVFSGAIPPARYNRSWWDLRRQYQGIVPPSPRGEAEFDPGAKYHVPASVPYMRYFLAHILQFQFHRGLVRAAGIDLPLHQASIYGSRAAGDRLNAMLEMGQSRPWPEALKAVTGERQMSADALREYFGPLERWLKTQVREDQTGW